MSRLPKLSGLCCKRALPKQYQTWPSCNIHFYIYIHVGDDWPQFAPCYEGIWFALPLCMSHVSHMNESCHTYEWDMSRIWMGHVTHMNQSCHAYEWIMSRIWMGHVTHMNESCYTCEWVINKSSCHAHQRIMSRIMSNIRIRLVMHMDGSCRAQSCHNMNESSRHAYTGNASCHAYEWVMSKIWISQIAHMNSCHA